MGRHVVGEKARAFGEAHALDLGDEVLQHHRHAGERSGCRWCLRERAFEHRGHHGVEGGVERLDPLDRGLDELGGRHLTAGDELGLAHTVQTAQLI